jgi:hypothetical protein
MSIHPFGKIIIETGNNIPFGSKEVSYTTLLFFMAAIIAIKPIPLKKSFIL